MGRTVRDRQEQLFEINLKRGNDKYKILRFDTE